MCVYKYQYIYIFIVIIFNSSHKRTMQQRVFSGSSLPWGLDNLMDSVILKKETVVIRRVSFESTDTRGPVKQMLRLGFDSKHPSDPNLLSISKGCLLEDIGGRMIRLLIGSTKHTFGTGGGKTS